MVEQNARWVGKESDFLYGNDTGKISTKKAGEAA
jgi:hypothetical protein